MKRIKKLMAWVLVLAMAVTLVPIRTVKAEEEERAFTFYTKVDSHRPDEEYDYNHGFAFYKDDKEITGYKEYTYVGTPVAFEVTVPEGYDPNKYLEAYDELESKKLDLSFTRVSAGSNRYSFSIVPKNVTSSFDLQPIRFRDTEYVGVAFDCVGAGYGYNDSENNNKAYVKRGGSYTLTLAVDETDTIGRLALICNDVDVTEQVVEAAEGKYTYTVTNVSEDLEFFIVNKESNVSITIEDSGEILDEEATVNGQAFNDGQVELSAKYGEDITLSVRGQVSDGGYYLLYDGEEVIKGTENNDGMDFTIKGVTRNLILRIGGAYKVQMPEDMLIIPCDVYGEPTDGTEGVNSCLVSDDEGLFYFKAKDGGKYSFTCDGLDSDYEDIWITNQETDNLVYALEQYSTKLFDIKAKKLCKLDSKTCIDNEINVKYGEEVIVLWSGEHDEYDEYYVPEASPFSFSVKYREEDYGDNYEYSGAYDVKDMAVVLGEDKLENPTPEIEGEGTPSRNFTYTYEIAGGISKDCVIDVSGIHRKTTLVIMTHIPKENLVIKDSEGNEMEIDSYNEEAVSCFISLGKNYTLEVTGDYANTVRVVNERISAELEPVVSEGKIIWDISGTDYFLAARENEYNIKTGITDNGINEVMLYNPSAAAQTNFNGLYMPDSDGKISFWIKQASGYDFSNPVIKIENPYDPADTVDVTISRSYEPVAVDSNGTKAYVYTIPLNKDIEISVYERTEEDTPEGNKIVVQDPPKKDDDDNGDNNTSGGTTPDPAPAAPNPAPATPDPASADPAPAATGTKLTDTSAKCDVKVISDDKADPQVAYAGASDKKATKVTVPEKVTIEGVTYKVTSIADKAFSGNKNLKTVTVGSNITTIGKSAFKNCKNLQKVEIKSKNITKIGADAFSGNKKLTKLVIKSMKIKSIGKNALKGTNKKLVIKVPKSKLKEYKKLFKNKGNKNVKVTK